MRRQSIFVRHNAEIAHRLSQLPGKCQNIHGHSLKIELTLHGEVNEQGILNGWDFGTVKRKFRSWIDTNWDHRLLLNNSDWWAHATFAGWGATEGNPDGKLPGLWVSDLDGDPTIENLCFWLGRAMYVTFTTPCAIRIQETGTNGAVWESA